MSLRSSKFNCHKKKAAKDSSLFLKKKNQSQFLKNIGLFKDAVPVQKALENQLALSSFAVGSSLL